MHNMRSFYLCQGLFMLNDDIMCLIDQGIDDQHKLLRQLQMLGHELTQSSISRRLKQLGISKLHGKYQRAHNIETSVIFVAPNMLVIHTVPGHAGVIAAKIDQQLVRNAMHPEFIGSIAGDDTIFVAVDVVNSDSAIIINKVKKII